MSSRTKRARTASQQAASPSIKAASAIGHPDAPAAASRAAGSRARAAAASTLPPLPRAALASRLHIDKSQAIELVHCLRHAVAPSASLVGSPHWQSPQMTSDSADAPYITRPLSHPTLGIRSLLFTGNNPSETTSADQATRMIVATADEVHVWRAPISDESDIASPSMKTPRKRSSKASAASPGQSVAAAAWKCEATIDLRTLSSAGALKCPWSECHASESTTATSRNLSSASTSPTDAPPVLVQLSPDESQLFIAVNRMAPAATSSDRDVKSASSQFLSPRPRASASAASRASPGTGSQALEAEFDSLFEQLEQSPKITQQTTQSPKSTTNKPKRGKRKAKDAIEEPHIPTTLVPFHAVYVLQLQPSFSDVAPAPVASPAPQAASPESQAGELDTMMAELLGEETTPKEKPRSEPARKTEPISLMKATAASHSSTGAACSHLQLLFTSPSAVSAILPLSSSEVLHGDEAGAITMWSRSGGGERVKAAGDNTAAHAGWMSVRRFTLPNQVTPAAVKSLFASDHDQSSFIAVYANGCVALWSRDVDRPRRMFLASLGTMSAVVRPSTSDSIGFVASPTTSTPSSSAGGGAAQEESKMEDIMIPETQFSVTQRLLPTQASSHHTEGKQQGGPVVHSVQRMCLSEDGESLHLLMLVSTSSTDHPHLSAPTPSDSKSSRRSSRKQLGGPLYPPVLCPSTLPTLVEVEIDLRTDGRGEEEVPRVQAYRVPLLLSDDNPSVHITSFAASVATSAQLQAKSAALKAADEDVPVYIASGLSSGALVIHSALSGSLTAIMSDAAPSLVNEDGEPLVEDEGVEQKEAPQACQGLDETRIFHSSSMFCSPPFSFLSSAHTPTGSRRRAYSPVPTATVPRSPGKGATTNKKRKGREEDDAPTAIDPSICPSTAPATSRRHLCTRAITAVAFHPTWNLLAVGDQQGHVHVFAPVIQI